MQNAWHAITTDGTTKVYHGIFDAPQEALDAAFQAAEDGECCFAMKECPDFPAEKYAGLPHGLAIELLTFRQLVTVQQFCRGCVEDCTAHISAVDHRHGDPVIVRRASWDADAGMWYRRAIRVLPSGETHEASHIVENTVAV